MEDKSDDTSGRSGNNLGDDNAKENWIIKLQKGSVSLLSLICVLACFLLASGYLYTAQAELRMSSRSTSALQAFNLAEGGVDLARSELTINSLWQPQTSYTLEPGTFTLSVTTNLTGYNVVSVGKVGEAVKKLEVRLEADGQNGWKIVSYKEIAN